MKKVVLAISNLTRSWRLLSISLQGGHSDACSIACHLEIGLLRLTPGMSFRAHHLTWRVNQITAEWLVFNLLSMSHIKPLLCFIYQLPVAAWKLKHWCLPRCSSIVTIYKYIRYKYSEHKRTQIYNVFYKSWNKYYDIQINREAQLCTGTVI